MASTIRRRGRDLVHHPLYRIKPAPADEFQILKVTGRYNDAPLEDLRSKVFLSRRTMP